MIKENQTIYAVVFVDPTALISCLMIPINAIKSRN
jgi:hypothetical protein